MVLWIVVLWIMVVSEIRETVKKRDNDNNDHDHE